MRILYLATLAALGLLASARAQEKPVQQKALDPALAKMAEMIGGVWSNDNPKFRVEFRYDWAFNKTVVRGVGVIDKGGAITEGVVNAPLDAVWNAFATKKGQEAWNVAHAEIDLKIGGRMRTHY